MLHLNEYNSPGCYPYNNIVELLQLDIIQEIMSQYYNDIIMSLSVEIEYDTEWGKEYNNIDITPDMTLLPLENPNILSKYNNIYIRLFITFFISDESIESQEDIFWRIKQMATFSVQNVNKVVDDESNTHYVLIDISDEWIKNNQTELKAQLFEHCHENIFHLNEYNLNQKPAEKLAYHQLMSDPFFDIPNVKEIIDQYYNDNSMELHLEIEEDISPTRLGNAFETESFTDRIILTPDTVIEKYSDVIDIQLYVIFYIDVSDITYHTWKDYAPLRLQEQVNDIHQRIINTTNMPLSNIDIINTESKSYKLILTMTNNNTYIDKLNNLIQ